MQECLSGWLPGPLSSEGQLGHDNTGSQRSLIKVAPEELDLQAFQSNSQCLVVKIPSVTNHFCLNSGAVILGRCPMGLPMQVAKYDHRIGADRMGAAL